MVIREFDDIQSGTTAYGYNSNTWTRIKIDSDININNLVNDSQKNTNVLNHITKPTYSNSVTISRAYFNILCDLAYNKGKVDYKECQTVLTEPPVINDEYSLEIIASNKERSDYAKSVVNQIGELTEDSSWEDIGTHTILAMSSWIPKKYLKIYGSDYKNIEIENTAKVKCILNKIVLSNDDIIIKKDQGCQTDLTEPPYRYKTESSQGNRISKSLINWGKYCIISEGEFQFMHSNAMQRNFSISCFNYITDKLTPDNTQREKALSIYFDTWVNQGGQYNYSCKYVPIEYD